MMTKRWPGGCSSKYKMDRVSVILARIGKVVYVHVPPFLVGYRLEYFHINTQVASSAMTSEMGLFSEHEDWPCCIAAGCSPTNNFVTKNIKNQLKLTLFVLREEEEAERVNLQ